jgi:hypothetical protein
MAGQKAKSRVVIGDRRRKVAELYLSRMNQDDVNRQGH